MRPVHREHHRTARIGWLRAAVLGANDGIVSTASLIVGVAASDAGRSELLGFGVEIAGELPEVERVAWAHDLEGTEREWVRIDRVGTRHRSAYRLCQSVHDTLAFVVSQDGGLRFIRWHDDGVTYWDQVATGLWDA